MLKHCMRDFEDWTLRALIISGEIGASFWMGCQVLEHALNSEPNDNKTSTEKSVEPFTKRDVSFLGIKILIF